VGDHKVVSQQRRQDVDSGYLRIARALLALTAISAFLDLQPLSIHWAAEYYAALESKSFPPSLLTVLAGAATTIALFAQKLGAFLEMTRLSPKTSVQTLRILTRVALIGAGLVLPVLLLIAYWYLTACLYAEPKLPELVTPDTAYRLDLWTLLLFGLIVFLFEANAYSLHQFYKDRLSKAFLFKPTDSLPESSSTRPNLESGSLLFKLKLKLKPFLSKLKAWFKRVDSSPSEPPALLDFKLSKIDPNNGPYHILNAALNVQGSKEANRRGRNADFFTFTRDFVGSDLTHFASTRTLDHTLGMEHFDPRLDLGSAMAISGAAISANMGSNTVRWLSPTLALLNIRLGYWLRNPRDLAKKHGLVRHLREIIYRFYGKFYLLLEMFNVLDENNKFIYLSDGGHIENLGIYQLLKRGCRLIVAVDAEADPEISCASLLKLERYARIDLGIRIIVPWEEIRERCRETSKAISTRAAKEAERHRGPHCAIGRIVYEDGSYGILLYFKSSLSGDEKDYVLDYKKRYSDFPHENTSDQFFTEEQFEVYRSLGYHIVEGYFSGTDEVSYLNDGSRRWPNIQAAKAEVRAALDWD
jgi:hypothetical protein